jgi:hypothetical protein
VDISLALMGVANLSELREHRETLVRRTDMRVQQSMEPC